MNGKTNMKAYEVQEQMYSWYRYSVCVDPLVFVSPARVLPGGADPVDGGCSSQLRRTSSFNELYVSHLSDYNRGGNSYSERSHGVTANPLLFLLQRAALMKTERGEI